MAYNKKNEIKVETAEHIQALANSNYAVEFPIDLNLKSMIQISLPEIKWRNLGATPSSIKISYTGKSVVLTSHWADKQRPHISGGPLLGTYAFCQLHFLWGRKDFRGGKHTYNRKTFPLEIHALFYKCEYGSRTEALKHKDGAIVIVFASKLDKQDNPAIEKVCSSLPALSGDDISSSVQVDPPFKISDLVHSFAADYFLYWGTMTTTGCNHLLLWMVCRKPFYLSSSQVHHFRKLMTAKQNHIINNSLSIARIHPNFKRVFHINPSRYSDDVLYAKGIPKNLLTVKDCYGMNGNTSDRPSTAGVRATRSEFQSGIDRPATSTGADNLRKGDHIFLRSFPVGREIERHGRNKSHESERCERDIENGKNDKLGIERSNAVTSGKDFHVSNTEGSGSQEEFICEDESVEHIFLGIMGGLEEFRKADPETINSEGSEHSFPNFVLNNVSSYFSEYDESAILDELSQKSYKDRKPRSHLTNPSDKTIRLASVKDSLEKIWRNFGKKGVGDDDDVSEWRADSGNMKEENKCEEKIVKTEETVSKQQKFKNFLRIKSKEVGCEKNTGKTVPQRNNTKEANSPPPRWRY